MQKEEKEKTIASEENKKIKKEHKDNKVNEKVSLTKKELEEMNKKISEAEEKFLRSQADLINYRKRKDEETERLLKFANEDLVLEILPILDNFERAMKMGEESKLLEGMNMVYSSLVKALEKFGVKEIASMDEKFDPMYHQAVATESVLEKEEDIILEVFQKGYMLKDKVIRPAMVKVNK